MQEEKITQSDIDDRLVTWILSHVEPWEDHRRQNYEPSWKEYYRQWKGVFSEEDKARKSERSRFISPALQQAIEMAVSEAEEATFGRRYWIDVSDDLQDPQKHDAEFIRNQLIEDMEIAKVSKSVSESYLNGAIYGQGIGKVIVEKVEEAFSDKNGFQMKERVQVSLVPISPFKFVIDPSAKTIDSGLGCAHIDVIPKIDVLKKIKDGIYFDVPLGSFSEEMESESFGESKSIVKGAKTEIIEWHGFIPKIFLLEIDDSDELDQELAKDSEDPDETDMVEAIVTIANRTALLKKVENPFIYKDRSFISFQYDTVPDRFMGRGVAEKGIQPQRALNAEIRSRQDGLALTIHPMMAIDSSRIPRGMKFEVGPGKTIYTNGDPRAIMMPLHFGDMSSHTYSEAGDLERMMQMATGSMDSATPVGISPRNQTATGMSMISAGSIKRSKRTMRNIEVDFLIPMINKFIWRYQQFDPERYPYGDYKLLPYSTMGIMAREIEQQQIAAVMNSLPDSPAKGILLKYFIENSSVQAKQELEQAIQQSFNPQPDPVTEKIKNLQLENAYLDNELKKREIKKVESETIENLAQADAKTLTAEVNRFNAVAYVQDAELDRRSKNDTSN